MLTATYSIVAITAEQDQARSRLSRLRQYLQSTWKTLPQIDFAFVDASCQRMAQFEHYFRHRKIELYLLPAMRAFGRESQQLLRELDAFSARAGALLGTVREQLRGIFDMRGRASEQMRIAIEGYCENLSLRLDREDRELLPLARRLLSVEDWFHIAAQMLADQAGAHRETMFVAPRAGMMHGRALNLRQRS